MNEYLIRRLKEGRTLIGLKQSEVAEKIGIKGNTLSNYENGVSEPDIDTFCALCDIYRLDPSEILGEAYGLGVQGGDFNIKPSEIDHIKKYRDLDGHGKEMVDFTLLKEWERSKTPAIVSLHPVPVLNAARPRTDLAPEDITEEMIQHDEDIMNDPNF